MTDHQPTGSGGREAELFRLLAEHVPDCAAFALDPHGQVRDWNPGAGRLFGHAAGEVVGRHAALFFTPEDVRPGSPRGS